MKLKDDLTVLDFGCGPGGTLMAFGEKTSPGAKLFGTDIDASAIKWCSKYLKKGHFTINSNEPPMAFENNFFDIIFAVSVFTHLNEQYQFDWLRDLHRIAKPGALLLLTVHGALAPAWKNIPQHQKDIFDKQGYYYYRNDGWGLFFPDFYHTTFHSKEYINKTWASFFNVLDIWELGLGGHQDIVSLIKK